MEATFDPGKLQIPVTLLFDGADAANAHEIEFLKSKHPDGKLAFIDLSVTPGRAADYGVSADQVQGKLYACDASGQVVSGIDALHAAHAAIGLGNWFAMCRLPGFLSQGTGIGPKK